MNHHPTAHADDVLIRRPRAHRFLVARCCQKSQVSSVANPSRPARAPIGRGYSPGKLGRMPRPIAITNRVWRTEPYETITVTTLQAALAQSRIRNHRPRPTGDL